MTAMSTSSVELRDLSRNSFQTTVMVKKSARHVFRHGLRKYEHREMQIVVILVHACKHLYISMHVHTCPYAGHPRDPIMGNPILHIGRIRIKGFEFGNSKRERESKQVG